MKYDIYYPALRFVNLVYSFILECSNWIPVIVFVFTLMLLYTLHVLINLHFL